LEICCSISSGGSGRAVR